MEIKKLINVLMELIQDSKTLKSIDWVCSAGKKWFSEGCEASNPVKLKP